MEEILTSLNSVFKDIGRFTTDSVIESDHSSKFKSVVPTNKIKWSGSSLVEGFYSLPCILYFGCLFSFAGVPEALIFSIVMFESSVLFSVINVSKIISAWVVLCCTWVLFCSQWISATELYMVPGVSRLTEWLHWITMLSRFDNCCSNEFIISSYFLLALWEN